MAAPTTLSILIPTTGRRPELLERVVRAHRILELDAQVMSVEGLTWGAGLNELALTARGDYWLCGCDDILPHAGWFDAARAMLDTGTEPAARYLNVDGAPLRPGTDDAAHGAPIPWCRAFLLTPAMYRAVGPFMDATWYSDIEYSERLNTAGWPIAACDGFTFTHLDGPRDWQTEEVAAGEERLYLERQRERAAG